jgi:flagellar biosynthetic protein FliP
MRATNEGMPDVLFISPALTRLRLAMKNLRKIVIAGVFAGLFLLPQVAQAQVATINPQVQISIQNGPGGNGNLSVNLQLLILFTILSVAPSLLIMMTSFVRIIIVLSFLRTGLSLQQPSNQVMLSLALFITFFIMAPTFQNIKKDALDPMQAGQITTQVALDRSLADMKTFMLRYTRQKDLALFMSMSVPPVKADSAQDISAAIVIPAYMLSELKTGFQMGMFVLLPFLVIDMVVASILMSMGMMMLPPPIVSLPLKVMVFVLVDGWTLVVHSIVQSFQ